MTFTRFAFITLLLTALSLCGGCAPMIDYSPYRPFVEYMPHAVLYVHIKEWTTTYIVIDSTTRVLLEYKLVDTKTGTVIWQHVGAYINSSSEGAGGYGEAAPIMMLVAAQVHAVSNAASNGE